MFPVSLKDGLFSNANVLFRARFRDGTVSLLLALAQLVRSVPPVADILLASQSVVERTTQRSTSSLYDKENAGGARPAGRGGKGPRTAGALTEAGAA